jgi:amidohydrolase
MAILLGLADVISTKAPKGIQVILFFQPAEETGAGAIAMLEDKAFAKIAPDLVFALHNLPGVKENTILIKDGSFSSSVKSMVIRITGTPAHAAEPEKGHNPIYLQSEIIQLCRNIEVTDPFHKDFCLITPTYIKAGLPHAHGISAGNGTLHLTFRTREERDMNRVTTTFLNALDRLSVLHQVDTAYNPVEAFPAISNAPEATARVREAAKACGLCISEMKLPFSWGEDFGHLTQRFPGAMFGFGAGLKAAPLHSDNYKFPDKIMGKAVELLWNTVNSE